MLQSISWAAFGEAVLILLLFYYLAIGLLYFRTEIVTLIRNRGKSLILLLVGSTAAHSALRAQTADGNTGLSQANTMIRSYFDNATLIMYGVGALLGLVGAIKVFSLLQANTHNGSEATKAASSWFLSCVFLVIVATVIKAFFGI